MKCSIKYVLLTAVKAKKVFDLLFIEAHNVRACTECAKLDGYKVVASKAGTKVFEMDALDVTIRTSFLRCAPPFLPTSHGTTCIANWKRRAKNRTTKSRTPPRKKR